MNALRTLKNLNKQLALALALTLLFQSVAAAATIVNDTFADANSQNQDLSNNSLRLFNGRSTTVRTDGPGSVAFDMTATGTNSEGFWSHFTDGAPVALGVGDRLSVSGTSTLEGFRANGQDVRFRLFDSRGSRNTTNLTGGMNGSVFADDTGYAGQFYASGTGGPFTLFRRTAPASNNILNALSAPEYTALPGSGASARQALVDNTPYTLTYTVERLSATETRLTASVTGGSLSGLTFSATETSSAPAATFDWFGFRVAGTNFTTKVAFTNLRADYTPAAPVITAQPQPSNLTVQVGSDVTMSVGASGNQLAYQWLKDGAPVAGNASATTPTLAITNAQLSDTGSYTAVVSNPGGSTSSSPASLAVSATGEGLFYQWYKNGALINGANGPALDFAAAQVADAGSYHVVVSNSGGSVTSASARLLVVSAMQATGFAPSSNATEINIDAPLSVTFDQAPKVGTAGKVRIYDAADNSLFDTIDLGVDTNTTELAVGVQSARAIGGSSALFNYYPVIVSGNTAAIYPSKKLAYGQTYYVTVEPGVVTDAAGAPFVGVADVTAWQFSTKQSGPAPGTTELTVAADGTGDFATVQGAVDFVPAGNTQPVTINVRKGTYTEIVYVRSNKPFITVRGEDRNESVVRYPNSNDINPGTGTRPVFGVDAPDFTLENITVHNTTTRFNHQNRTRQAEAFRGNNNRILINRVNLKSFQDTLLLQGQSNQGGFLNESYIEGDVDFLWGSGAVYFRNTELKMVSSNAYYTQIRNGEGRNGYVFVNCRLTSAPGVTDAYLTRIDPDQFPYSQVVFIDSVMGPHVRPDAWRLDDNAKDGFTAPLTQEGYPNVRFWEYNTRDEAGNPADTSQRHPISRQITADEAAYWREPANVLGGWVPELGTSTISLAGLSQTYTGQPAAASVITEPANLAVQVTYNGSAEAPVAPGSYEVVATITEPGYTGTATGTLVIEKAQANVTVESASYTADGTPKAVAVTTDPAGLGVEVTYNGSNAAPTRPGTYAVVATVVDANYQGTGSGTLTIVEAPNTPPVLTLPSDITVEATSATGAVVNFDATATDAEDGTLGVLLSRQPGTVFPLGTTAVTATAQDSKGLTATGTFNVTVRDTTAPDIQGLTASPSVITKPNGKMVPVVITASVNDAVSPTPATRIISVTGSEDVSGDWQITGDLTLQVRAERNSKADRVYTITVESRDGAGNASTRTVDVTVR